MCRTHTTLCNMAELNNNNHNSCSSQCKLLQALAEAAACCTLHAAHCFVVAIIEAQRCRCCCVECNICRQFLLCVVYAIVSKTCAAASHLCGKVCPLLPPPLPARCLFYACLMSCLKIYCHKLMQAASCADRNRKTNTGDVWPDGK